MLEHAVVLCKEMLEELIKIEDDMRCSEVDITQIERIRKCNRHVTLLHSAILRGGVSLGGDPHPRYTVYKIPMLAEDVTGHIFATNAVQ
jgi:hypothetical protein